jgi:hypothetical protein
VDFSYVDEDDIVRFYSDTKERVFPRSPGVIGRKVQNCHPRESVSAVNNIIKAFREGRESTAEFWLEMGGKFIYILYVAVRDDEGNYRGVLEMMQDATRIRSLEGSKKLLDWNGDPDKEQEETTALTQEESATNELTPQSKIGPLIEKYPFLKQFLVSLSPKFKKLNNPIAFKAMSGIATIDMLSARSGIGADELIEKIEGEIKAKTAEKPG